MKKDMEVLKRCPLFANIAEGELKAMLSCLGGTIIEAARNQIIFAEGDPAKQVGIILSGCVQIVRDDYYGNRTIVTSAEPGDLVAESFACADVEHLPVSVVASCDSRILLVNCRRLLTSCSNSCEFHAGVIKNLLHILAQNNIRLNQKIEVTSQRTTREKLMTYLLSEAKKQGADAFEIPFDRQELADYLGVERSAMSAELGKMKKEGILETRKSWFRLLK